MLSITSLKARQIIGGKLATSFLQTLVFLSALSPCIAFTYLLRGIDILTILMLVGYATLASVGLSLVSLLLATCAMERYRQVVASVMLVLALGGLYCFGCTITGEWLRHRTSIDVRGLFTGNLALLSAYGSYFVLFYLAAAAQLSFASSNRSTAVRIVMVVQQALFCGWVAYFCLQDGALAVNAVTAVLVLSGLHWYAMGIFLIGEPERLSPRVQRDLPQSFLGRAFFTWFNPGAGTGYVFAISNYLAVVLLAQIAVRFCGPDLYATRALANVRMLYVGLAGLCYLTIYLGVSKLLLSAVRRGRAEGVGILLRVLLSLLLVAGGVGIPLVIQMSFDSLRNTGYSLLHITNPLWSLEELCKWYATFPPDAIVLLVGLVTAATLVLLANLPSVVAEVRQVRVLKPVRVAEEDAQQAAQNRPVEMMHSSPWD